MPREQSEAALLDDMPHAAEPTLRLTAGESRASYEQNEMLRLAVERSIEIIGEAARRVRVSFRAAHPEIAWRPIMATRHILAHDYDAVNNDTVWRIVTATCPRSLSNSARVRDGTASRRLEPSPHSVVVPQGTVSAILPRPIQLPAIPRRPAR